MTDDESVAGEDRCGVDGTGLAIPLRDSAMLIFEIAASRSAKLGWPFIVAPEAMVPFRGN